MDPRMAPLVEQYLGLAQSLAQQVWRTAPHALELDELRAIAWFGLVDAADRWYPYCERKNYSPDAVEFFRPYVVRRVYGSLRDAIRSADWASRNLRSRVKALRDAGQEGGASYAELAERTGLTVAKVRDAMRDLGQRPMSLEAEELDPHSANDVESSVFTRVVLEQVVAAVRDLPPEQQIVVALHYHQGQQLQEVARIMGITETHVGQMHADAVLTIHQRMLHAAGTARAQ